MIRRILLFPHIKVHNANALSSPFTIGFPAMTAWLGAVHGLQRKISKEEHLENVTFDAVGVISHHVDLQVYKGQGDYVNSIIGTGNPLDQDGSRPSFIEEARCHLDVSLVIEYEGSRKDNEEILLKKLIHYLHASMKIAGGDVLSFEEPEFYKVEEGDDSDLKKLIRKLMPGYALIERRELMVEAMKENQDALDSLLNYLAIHHSCEQDSNDNVTWTSQRKTAGWIVPIATGFHGISATGKAKNQRDPNVPHRFAESVITLGEFRMLHHIQSLDEILWKYHVDLDNDLYVCRQDGQRRFN